MESEKSGFSIHNSSRLKQNRLPAFFPLRRCLLSADMAHLRLPLTQPKRKATPRNSAAVLTTAFLPSLSCRNSDLPPVNLRFLQSNLTKEPLIIAPLHLRGVDEKPAAHFAHFYTRWVSNRLFVAQDLKSNKKGAQTSSENIP